ncbi:MAG: hypothetical protein ACLGH3_01705 [Actinomycetota bacterium]
MSLVLTAERLATGEHVPADELAHRIADALHDGERWFGIWGEDPYLHIAVSALLEYGECLSPLDAPRLDDPFAASARPATVALRPLGPNGLAATFGLSGHAIPADPQRLLSANLDVGRVTGSGGSSAHLVVGATVEQQGDDTPLVLSEVDRRPGREDPGSSRHSLRGASMVISNGQFLLDTRVAPKAVPYDGALDVGIMRAGRFREGGVWRKIARGDRVGPELFQAHLVDLIEIDGPVFLAVDAHVGIEGPLRIEVHQTPLALWL